MVFPTFGHCLIRSGGNKYSLGFSNVQGGVLISPRWIQSFFHLADSCQQSPETPEARGTGVQGNEELVGYEFEALWLNRL